MRNTSRTNTTLTFEWQRLPCGQRGGPNDFNYELRDAVGNKLYSDVTKKLSVTFWELQQCALYSFVVRAVNDAGEGSFSIPVNGETDEDGEIFHFKHIHSNEKLNLQNIMNKIIPD